MAETYDIPSYGIQQGWPSIMHSGFRRFPFRYFFTWGMGFNNLWSQYNSHPHFVSVGYMYEILEQQQKEHTCISFFLQSPNFLSDSHYFDSLLKLIPIVAQKYPNLTFLVREHPEYKLESVLIDYWKHLPNIEIVSDCDLSKVYSRSRIVISHFSSSLMECLVHGCIPLVFDPTTHSRYNPDIEQEGLGLISSDEDSFFNKFEIIIKGQFYQRPCHDVHYWFESIGDNAINNILNNIVKAP